jgi:hypothetical protein
MRPAGEVIVENVIICLSSHLGVICLLRVERPCGQFSFPNFAEGELLGGVLSKNILMFPMRIPMRT